MENLLFYLLGEFLACSTIVKCDTDVAGEDAWRIEIEYDGHFVHSCTLLRSEIRLVRDYYEERKLYMCDSERADFDKLIAVL